MGRSPPKEFATEIRGGDTLVSRWADAPNEAEPIKDAPKPKPAAKKPRRPSIPASARPPKQDSLKQEPLKQDPKPPKLEPPKPEPVLQPPKPNAPRQVHAPRLVQAPKQVSRPAPVTAPAAPTATPKSIPANAKLESKWAKNPEQPPKDWDHHKSKPNESGSPKSKQSLKPLAKHPENKSKPPASHPDTSDAGSHSRRSHRRRRNSSKAERTSLEGNRLAAHLNVPVAPTAAQGLPAPAHQPASSWSFDTYEPGEDWATAEEDTFRI